VASSYHSKYDEKHKLEDYSPGQPGKKCNILFSHAFKESIKAWRCD
jgi:hypothetical protein